MKFMEMKITETTDVSDNGYPIVLITVNGITAKAERLPDGSYREYDDSYKQISYTYVKETDENDVEEVRREIDKNLVQISGGRYLGVHVYTTKTDDFKTPKTAVVVWSKSAKLNKWLPAYGKGLNNLTLTDIKTIAEVLN